MIFSYNWLQEYIEGKLPKPKKLSKKITMHFMEIEEMKKEKDDWILDIDILPNRSSDCLSHVGVAREIAAFTEGELKMPGVDLKETDEKTKNWVNVDVKDKNNCLRYQAKVIKNVEVKESPDWIKKRLEACGLQSINNIVDIVNYVMLETGQPLHAFDFKKIEGEKPKTIFVDILKKEEKIEGLDDKKYKLIPGTLVIQDKKGTIAIAGVKGGKRTGTDKNTKTVVLEAANFYWKKIREVSRALKLKTDASWRFENELDPNLTEFALKRAAYLIQKEAGGEPLSGEVDFYPKERKSKKILLNSQKPSKILGEKISKKKIKSILNSLEFKVKEKKEKLEVEVPTFRYDINIEEDIIEEIGRIIGFTNIKTQMPTTLIAAPKERGEIKWKRISRDILKEKGFDEVYNYSFISIDQKEKFDFDKELVKLENPLSSEKQYLRPSLIPNLVKNIKSNLNNFDSAEFFEIGKIFLNKNSSEEKNMLSGAIYRKGNTKQGFYELKGMLESLFDGLGITEVLFNEAKEKKIDNIWHKNRCAQIKASGEKIGILGEISPGITMKHDIEERIFAFDINFEKLIKLASEENEYEAFSKYPSSIRDVSILVPEETKTVEVLNVINNSGGRLIRDVDLFDVYTGNKIGKNEKNFAFHIVYQAEDHTLKKQEVDEVHKKVIKKLEENKNWQVRKNG